MKTLLLMLTLLISLFAQSQTICIETETDSTFYYSVVEQGKPYYIIQDTTTTGVCVLLENNKNYIVQVVTFDGYYLFETRFRNYDNFNLICKYRDRQTPLYPKTIPELLDYLNSK